MSNRSLIVLILAAAVAAGVGLWLGQRQAGGGAPAAAATQAALMYPQPRAIAPFTLERADGSAFTPADLQGRWSLLFFGFTHCPDVCPITLAAMRQVEQQLTQQAPGTAVQMVFVSVDPERDRGATLGDYARYFSPSIVAVTGADDVLRPFTQGLGIVYMKTPLADGNDYTVDHSAQLVLIDPQGRMVGMFRPPLDAARIAADLAALAHATPGAKP